MLLKFGVAYSQPRVMIIVQWIVIIRFIIDVLLPELVFGALEICFFHSLCLNWVQQYVRPLCCGLN